MTNATPDTNVSAYRRGWQASKRSTTADLDAASDRYVKRYGRAQLGAFIAGWSDYAADAPYEETLPGTAGRRRFRACQPRRED